MPLTLAVPAQQQLTTAFTIDPSGVTGTQITATFDTMPGNQPNSNANTLFLWQTSTYAVPTSTTPLNTQPIASNTPNGSYTFTGLSVSTEAYLVGFGVGATPQTIVSLILIPAMGTGPAVPQSLNSSVTVTQITPNSIPFSYVMPSGQQPLANGDWVGLWEGQGETVLYTTAPNWSGPINSNSSSGNSALNLASGVIKRGTQYTLGYFKTGWATTNPKQTTLACSATFNT